MVDSDDLPEGTQESLDSQPIFFCDICGGGIYSGDPIVFRDITVDPPLAAHRFSTACKRVKDARAAFLKSCGIKVD